MQRVSGRTGDWRQVSQVPGQLISHQLTLLIYLTSRPHFHFSRMKSAHSTCAWRTLHMKKTNSTENTWGQPPRTLLTALCSPTELCPFPVLVLTSALLGHRWILWYWIHAGCSGCPQSSQQQTSARMRNTQLGTLGARVPARNQLLGFTLLPSQLCRAQRDNTRLWPVTS